MGRKCVGRYVGGLFHFVCEIYGGRWVCSVVVQCAVSMCGCNS